MSRLIIRLAINAVALYAAIALVPGIQPQDTNLLSLIWLALIFGVVNAFLRPFLKLLTCPLILLTLGLFTLILNTFLFWLAGVIGAQFGVGFTVTNIWAAILGSIIVSIVSVFLSMLFKDELNGKSRGRKRNA